MTPVEELNRAETLMNENVYDEAVVIYLGLRQRYKEFAPFCNYRIAAISNNTGDPLTAYDLYYKAFSAKPDLAAILYGSGHSSHGYVYSGKKDEMELTACPLCCASDVQAKWCYPLPEAQGYNSFFNPIRLWMYCQPCHHIFARYFPEKLFLYNDSPRAPDPAFFSYYSDILNRVKRRTPGITLFEVGIGACECLLAAREMGFDASGIDVIDKHAQMARDKYGLNAQTADFVEFQPDKKFDVIIMGDVLEHVSDPVLALRKAHELINDDGALWVSTPNFDSAFSIAAGHNDAMRRQQYHLNYFSRRSFYTLLDNCGFTPVDYSISSHYNGSMEVISVIRNR